MADTKPVRSYTPAEPTKMTLTNEEIKRMEQHSIKLSTAEIITIGDGRIACEVEDLVVVLNRITNDNLYTHQLIRACDFTKPYVVDACPWVTDLPELDIEGKENKKEVVLAWVESISKKVGESHEVPVLDQLWEKKDPLVELIDLMAGNDSQDDEPAN